MKRSRAATAAAVLQAFLEQTRGQEDWQRALRALTLFMVKGHAPKFFERQKLGRLYAAAVRNLAAVPRRLPLTLPALEAMSRLDAAWVEHAVGKKPRLPPAREARAYLEDSARRDGPLWAWVMSELCVQLGLEACWLGIEHLAYVDDPGEEEQLYWTTHHVLFATRYLSQPPQSPEPTFFDDILVELQNAIGPVQAWRQYDLLSEIAFCIQALGADFEPAMAFEPFISESGQLGEETGYSGTHAGAAALVALAGALDRAG